MSAHVHAAAGATGQRAGARYFRHLAGAFGLTLVFLVVEVVGAWLTNSLALLSDAGHMLADVAALGLALAAIHAAGRAAHDGQRTFGLYRLEVLAAAANAVLLIGVAAYVLYEAASRFLDPPEVLSGPMLVIAVAGLAANLGALALLHRGARESLNLRAASLEVLADTLGSLGVIAAAAVMYTTGWAYADPLIAAAIGVFVVPRAWSVGREALRVLLQAAPAHVDVPAVRSELGGITGVVDAHDVHVWTVTSGMEVASAHLEIARQEDASRVLREARALLRERYQIAHATIQVEDPGGCETDLDW